MMVFQVSAQIPSEFNFDVHRAFEIAVHYCFTVAADKTEVILDFESGPSTAWAGSSYPEILFGYLR